MSITFRSQVRLREEDETGNMCCGRGAVGRVDGFQQRSVCFTAELGEVRTWSSLYFS